MRSVEIIEVLQFIESGFEIDAAFVGRQLVEFLLIGPV